MKKVLSLLLIVVFISSLFLGAAYASDNNFITANLTVDVDQHLVTVTGNAPAGQNSQVSILVKSPSETVEYIGQRSCGTGGSFAFAFNLKQPAESGYYTVQIGGVGVDTPKRIWFTAGGQVTDVQYTVAFHSNGGSAVSSQTVVSGAKASRPADPTRSGYSFAGWYSNSSLTSVFDFANTTITGNTTIYAKWNIIQASQIIPTVTPTPTPSSTPTATPSPLQIKVVPEVVGDAAKSRINLDDLNKAFDSAKKDGHNKETVTISMAAVEGVSKYIQELPSQVLTSTSVDKVVILDTPVGVITLPSNMLANNNIGDSKSVGVTIEKADISKLSSDVKEKVGSRPVIDLSLQVNGKALAWSNPDAPVTIQIDYTPTQEELKNTENIVVWYIDGNGKIISVPSGRYDSKSGKVTFTTTHFSNYAVAFVKKSFADISKYHWIVKPVETLASKGVIEGTSENNFSPDKKITRGEYITWLVKTLGLTAKFDSNFTDAKSTSAYYEALGIAKKLGIAGGGGNNKFGPDKEISRQDMMALTIRALKVAKVDLKNGYTADIKKYTDASKVAKYAVEDVATMVKSGLISGSGKKLNPTASTTRAEVAILLYRIYSR